MNNSWKGTGRYSTVGLELALSILLGLFSGRWMEQKLGGAPWPTLVGLGFGAAAGVRFVWRALKQANEEASRQDEQDREAREKFHED